MTDSAPPFELNAERLMGLDDKELALATYGLFVEYHATRHGLPASELSDTSINRLAAAIDEMDPDTPNSVILQRSFSLVLSGNTAKAGKLLRKHFQDRSLLCAALQEAVTGSRRQRQNASQGGGDRLTKLIDKLVEESKGNISEKALVHKLVHRGSEPYWTVQIGNETRNIIDDVDDAIYVLNSDGTGNKKVEFSAIRGRLSRAKAKYRKHQSR